MHAATAVGPARPQEWLVCIASRMQGSSAPCPPPFFNKPQNIADLTHYVWLLWVKHCSLLCDYPQSKVLWGLCAAVGSVNPAKPAALGTEGPIPQGHLHATVNSQPAANSPDWFFCPVPHSCCLAGLAYRHRNTGQLQCVVLVVQELVLTMTAASVHPHGLFGDASMSQAAATWHTVAARMLPTKQPSASPVSVCLQNGSPVPDVMMVLAA